MQKLLAIFTQFYSCFSIFITREEKQVEKHTLYVMFHIVFKRWGLSLRKQETFSASLTFLQDLRDSSSSVWPKNNAVLWAKGNIPDLLAQSTFSLQILYTASSFGSLFLAASKTDKMYIVTDILDVHFQGLMTMKSCLCVSFFPLVMSLRCWVYFWIQTGIWSLIFHLGTWSDAFPGYIVSFMLLLNEIISISFHAEDKISCNCNKWT